MLLNIPVPNLISGVSQQAPSMRFPSQANEQVNCRSSLIEGLTKRPPTRHVAKLLPNANAGSYETFSHWINRDPSERYVVLVRGDVTGARLKVFGIDGVEHPVVYDSGTQAYLDGFSASPADSVRMLTIADYTFVVNREKTVALDASTTATRRPEALVTIVAGNYGSTYTVRVGSTNYSHTTSTTNPGDLDTSNIAAALFNLMNASLTAAGYTVSVNKSTIWIRRTSDQLDFSITYTDSQSQRSMSLVKGEVNTLTELPTVGPDGFVVKVVGDPDSEEDEYWVRFRATDGYVGVLSEGVWEESFAPGIQYRFDLTTMPHVIVREPIQGGIQFRLRRGEWAERTVGDAATAEAPSIVGRKISDVFFFKNRIGFLAGIDKVVLGESSNYFNLWRTTVVTTIDSDPIDLGVAHSRASALKAAVPFQDRLILFSDQTQFSLQSTGQVLGPSTVSITQTTEFECDLSARPVATASSILFAQSRGSFSGIREYYQSQSVENSFDSIDVTANVSAYLRNKVTDIDVSTAAGMAVVRTAFPAPTDDEEATIYVYQFFSNGGEKIQSSWSRWTFPRALRVIGSGWIDVDLHLLVLRDDALYLESIRVQDSQRDPSLNYLVHLDRKVAIGQGGLSYSTVTNRTEVTVPYFMQPDDAVLLVNGRPVRWTFKMHDASTSRFWVDGNLNPATSIIAGINYLMRYEMGTPFLRVENRIISSGRLGLTYGRVNYADSAFFQAKVTPMNRSTYAYEHNSGLVQAGITLDSPVSLKSGTMRFPIHARNEEVTIAFENGTHLPCRLTSAEIEGNFVTRSRA